MKAKAYVDGSFNGQTRVYGAGAVLFVDGFDPVRVSQAGDDPVFARSMNVAGEILAASIIIEACKQIPNLEELTLYYDYAGIECWPKGLWKANTRISKEYQLRSQDLPYKLSFRKVKAHSNDEWNDEADKLAKKACGIPV